MRTRGAGAILAALVLSFALAPAASANEGVRLEINGGGTHYLGEAQIEAANDVSDQFTTRSQDGSSTYDHWTGTNIATLIELAHVPRRFVASVAVKRTSLPDYVTLTGDEVRDGFDGESDGRPRPAFVYAAYGHGAQFFRPVRDGTDQNVRDHVTSFNDEDIVVKVTTTNDTVRKVVASADDPSPQAGEQTGFSAHVSEPPGGVGFTYSWDFGDGNGEDGPSVTHPFEPGHYRVTVTAVGDDGSSGVSSPIDVQVSKPKPSATPEPSKGRPGAGGGAQAGGGEAPKTQGTSGPNKSRSRTRATRKPASTPTPAPTGTAAPQQQPQNSGTGPGAGAGLGTGSGPGAPGAGTPTGRGSGTPHDASTQSPPASPATPAAPVRGEPVDGIVLAGAGSAADIIASVRAAAEQDHAPARRGGGGDGSVAGWVGGSGLLVVLLGLGAVREGGLRWRARSA